MIVAPRRLDEIDRAHTAMVASRHAAAAMMTTGLDRHRPRGGRALIATSGGPDSMALLALSLALHDRRTPVPFDPIVGHVDHGLRDESADEAAFLAEVAARLGVPFECRRLHWPSDGTRVSSDAAREARWAALDELAVAVDADAILTAHHADDQAETVLMRLARGTGLDGIAGIPEARLTAGGRLVLRPLLACERSTLMTLVEDARLPHIADPTNDDVRRPRERIRHEVLPALEAIHPGAARHLAALARESAVIVPAEEADTTIDAFDRVECRALGPEIVASRLRKVARSLSDGSITSIPRAVWQTAAAMIVDGDPGPRRLSIGSSLELRVHRNSAGIRTRGDVETPHEPS